MTPLKMKLYAIEKQEDGSVKVESILTPEEMLFMLEFALINLLAQGVAPNTVIKEIQKQSAEGSTDQEAQPQQEQTVDATATPDEALEILKSIPDDKFFKA